MSPAKSVTVKSTTKVPYAVGVQLNWLVIPEAGPEAGRFDVIVPPLGRPLVGVNVT